MAGAARGDGATETVSAYVILSDGAKSRVFKLSGYKKSPRIDELDAATTLDLKRFQDAVKNDLGDEGTSSPLDKTWACEIVRIHLRADLGL